MFAGIAVVLLFAFHGATYLTLRTTGDLCERAAAPRPGGSRCPRRSSAPAFLVWTVAVAVDRNDKDVFPVVVPAALGDRRARARGAPRLRGQRAAWAFAVTALGRDRGSSRRSSPACIRGCSSRTRTSPTASTISNAASAHYALTVMTVVALIVTPLVLLYQGWTYYVFRARLGGEEVRPSEAIAPPDGGSTAG